GQPVVNVKHRVLQTLGHDWSGGLLELEHEMGVGGACFGIKIFRKPEDQDVAEKIEDRFFNCRIPALGRSDGALDHLSILFTHRPPRREISPVYRKTGDRLAYGTGQRFERKIAIPSILLGEPIDHEIGRASWRERV